LFLLGDAACKMQGNLLYSTLFADFKNIHWIGRGKWDVVDQMAETFAQERAQKNIKTLVVPKGANCTTALPGALTLPSFHRFRNRIDLLCTAFGFCLLE
jgi:hypothetical protein